MSRNLRARSGRDLRRSPPKRLPYPRVLIVCEGKKTEVNYFEEVRQKLRISTLHITVIHSPEGQEPKQIVKGAENEFKSANKKYERVCAVFDRDEHRTYENAIRMAEARDGKWKNDEKKKVQFQAIVSVPCFELWLLLHFIEIHACLHRHEALARLKHWMPDYEKGMLGIYEALAEHLPTATQRAEFLVARFDRIPGEEPYTDVHHLVHALQTLKDEPQ